MTLEYMKQALLGALESLNILSKSPRIRLYDAAVASIGRDASPNDVAPDEYGCAESVYELFRVGLKLRLGPTPIVSTRSLLAALRQSRFFTQVQSPLPGDIVIAATGDGNGVIKNGHCGVVGRMFGPDGTLWVMSNDSRLKTFEVNFTLGSFNRYYGVKGGYPIYYFTPVNL